MSKQYYGELLLEGLPSEPNLPYVVLCYNTSSNKYQAIYGASPWYVNTNNSLYMDSNSDNLTYTLDNGVWTKGTTYFDKGGYGNRRFFWTTHDLPYGSSTASTTICLGAVSNTVGYKTAEVSSGTTLTTSIEAEVGTWVLATVAVRSAFTAPSGWTVLHETGQIGFNQKIVLLCKQCDSDGTVSFTATQATAERIYINLIAWVGCQGFAYHSGSEFLDTTTQSVSWTRPRPNFSTIIWCMTKNSWSTSSPYPNWTCDTLSKSVQLPKTTQQKLCNFIDDSSAVSRTFVSGSSSDAGIIIDCVEVLFTLPYEKKYLIKSGSTLYTVEDGALVALSETVVTSTLFSESGFDELPTWSILSTLTNPELMFWDEDDEATLPTITAAMTATPPAQTLTATPMTIPSNFRGIQYCTVTSAGNPKIALKFDSGDFEYYNGTDWVTAGADEGMTPSVMLAITAADWTTKFQNHTSLTIRVILDTINDKISLIRFKFAT